ncbi:hypothetical protein ACWKSP_28100 [Micromonosporaceae bacterium Da 78-11]
MSEYAFDPLRREIVVVWPVSVGSLAQVVAEVTPGTPEEYAAALCAALSRLSQALWDTYVRPASAADDEPERLRREEEREQFDSVPEALDEPSMPDEYGLMVVFGSPVEESAHQVGRMLHLLDDPKLFNAVTAEVQAERDAVSRAELGDLSGRAAQAVTLDRLDVSPVQVAAADDVLQRDPLDAALLSAAIDPAAACVAAAHWLAAAAVVAAEAAGNTPAGVFAEAYDIQAVSVQVPALVVEAIEDDGLSPHQIVLQLLQAAVAAANGEIADLAGVLAERAQLEEFVQQLPPDQRDEMMAAEPVRTTPLDPRRPARDLLEHLLDGIASGELLYAEYVSGGADPDVDDAVFDEPVEDASPDPEGERRDVIAEKFADLVRAQAAATRERMG